MSEEIQGVLNTLKERGKINEDKKDEDNDVDLVKLTKKLVERKSKNVK